ncbi:hypothetical protein BC828DRAFT_384053 [Blastocladiella britannica]|nr:hypothetical protein BC828DRAFT_384053 [Blastocladiella britannica]
MEAVTPITATVPGAAGTTSAPRVHGDQWNSVYVRSTLGKTSNERLDAAVSIESTVASSECGIPLSKKYRDMVQPRKVSIEEAAALESAQAGQAFVKQVVEQLESYMQQIPSLDSEAETPNTTSQQITAPVGSAAAASPTNHAGVSGNSDGNPISAASTVVSSGGSTGTAGGNGIDTPHSKPGSPTTGTTSGPLGPDAPVPTPSSPMTPTTAAVGSSSGSSGDSALLHTVLTQLYPPPPSNHQSSLGLLVQPELNPPQELIDYIERDLGIHLDLYCPATWSNLRELPAPMVAATVNADVSRRMLANGGGGGSRHAKAAVRVTPSAHYIGHPTSLFPAEMQGTVGSGGNHRPSRSNGGGQLPDLVRAGSDHTIRSGTPRTRKAQKALFPMAQILDNDTVNAPSSPRPGGASAVSGHASHRHLSFREAQPDAHHHQQQHSTVQLHQDPEDIMEHPVSVTSTALSVSTAGLAPTRRGSMSGRGHVSAPIAPHPSTATIASGAPLASTGSLLPGNSNPGPATLGAATAGPPSEPPSPLQARRGSMTFPPISLVSDTSRSMSASISEFAATAASNAASAAGGPSGHGSASSVRSHQAHPGTGSTVRKSAARHRTGSSGSHIGGSSASLSSTSSLWSGSRRRVARLRRKPPPIYYPPVRVRRTRREPHLRDDDLFARELCIMIQPEQFEYAPPSPRRHNSSDGERAQRAAAAQFRPAWYRPPSEWFQRPPSPVSMARLIHGATRPAASASTGAAATASGTAGTAGTNPAIAGAAAVGAVSNSGGAPPGFPLLAMSVSASTPNVAGSAGPAAAAAAGSPAAAAVVAAACDLPMYSDMLLLHAADDGLAGGHTIEHLTRTAPRPPLPSLIAAAAAAQAAVTAATAAAAAAAAKARGGGGGGGGLTAAAADTGIVSMSESMNGHGSIALGHVASGPKRSNNNTKQPPRRTVPLSSRRPRTLSSHATSLSSSSSSAPGGHAGMSVSQQLAALTARSRADFQALEARYRLADESASLATPGSAADSTAPRKSVSGASSLGATLVDRRRSAAASLLGTARGSVVVSRESAV